MADEIEQLIAYFEAAGTLTNERLQAIAAATGRPALAVRMDGDAIRRAPKPSPADTAALAAEQSAAQARAQQVRAEADARAVESYRAYTGAKNIFERAQARYRSGDAAIERGRELVGGRK